MSGPTWGLNIQGYSTPSAAQERLFKKMHPDVWADHQHDLEVRARETQAEEQRVREKYKMNKLSRNLSFEEELVVIGFRPETAQAMANSKKSDFVEMNQLEVQLMAKNSHWINSNIKHAQKESEMKGSEILNHLAAGKHISLYENGFYRKLTTDEVFAHIKNGRSIAVLHKYDASQKSEPDPHPEALRAMDAFTEALLAYERTPPTTGISAATKLTAAEKALKRWLIRVPTEAEDKKPQRIPEFES